MARAPSTVDPQTPRIVYPHIHRADRLSKELDMETWGDRSPTLTAWPSGSGGVSGPCGELGGAHRGNRIPRG